MSVILKDKKLTTLINKLATNASTFREDVHRALIGATFHAFEHGNADMFNRICDAVGSGTRKKGIVAWATRHAPVYIRDEKFKLSADTRKAALGSASAEELAMYAANERKWYESVEKEPLAPKSWDGVEFLRGVQAYIEKAAKKAQTNCDTGSYDLLTEIGSQLAKSLNANYDVIRTPDTETELKALLQKEMLLAA